MEPRVWPWPAPAEQGRQEAAEAWTVWPLPEVVAEAEAQRPAWALWKIRRIRKTARLPQSIYRKTDTLSAQPPRVAEVAREQPVLVEEVVAEEEPRPQVLVVAEEAQAWEASTPWGEAVEPEPVVAQADWPIPCAAHRSALLPCPSAPA